MEVITTHTSTDFDGLASMIAAQKLYPEAIMVFPGKLSINVEEFMSLHKDIFNIVKPKNINFNNVTRLILLDTKNPQRIGTLAELFNYPQIDIHLFDHHPWAEGDLHGSLEIVEMIGSTTTLMVERLARRHIDITPLEATVMALGIYSDTGSLLFTNTTSRDITAAAHLLEQGANLAVVSEFIDRPFTREQDMLLKKLLISNHIITVHGLKVLVAWAEIEEYVEGLSFLTHTIADIEKSDAIFTVVKMEGRIHIVARSKIPQINAANILSPFNGAGHPTAASATVKNDELAIVTKKLDNVIRKETKPTLLATDIMSTPVKTVFQETTIHEAHKVMMRYGHTGLPVIEGFLLKGIISQRDVEKAFAHGLGHAPVKGFMRSNVLTVTPKAPISTIRKMLVSNDIGRVPVVEDGRLLGIVSRTDILVTLHGDTQRKHPEMYWQSSNQKLANNIYDAMQKKLLPSALSVLQQAGHIAREMNYKAFTAGGVVRDLLLGYDNIDVDIVIEGDGIAVAAFLAEQLGAKLKIHRRFGTAELIFSDGFKVDVATTRVEYYEYPAALPQVESATLRQDLYRRDFSINAMAASINEDSFGEILDYFGGREDLQLGYIRILYNLSFIEDPIRILRAVRFEQRYKMKIEPQTLKLLNTAVHKKYLYDVSNVRLWDEIRNIMMEPFADKMFYRLEHLKVWEQIFPGINYWKIQSVLLNIKNAQKKLFLWGFGQYDNPWMPMLIALLYLSASETVINICEKYSLNKKQVNKITACLNGWEEILNMLEKGSQIFQPSDIAEKLNELPIESYPLLYTLLEGEKQRKGFKKILFSMRDNHPSVSGDYIKSLGYKPGPIYRLVLKELWRAKLNGLVKNEKQEKDFIQTFLNKR